MGSSCYLGKWIADDDFQQDRGGRGSLVVKVSDHGWHVMSSSRVPLKTHRVGERCTLNLPRAQTVKKETSPGSGASWLTPQDVPEYTGFTPGVTIVRVHYFVRGGFVGYRSRASSKASLPLLIFGRRARFLGVKGLRCSCRCTCGGQVHKESRLDVDVFEK
ncbi:hypothetical protein TNCV_3495781 [Trichonephila clavipes]|nr:hypothetical protein TNCV_3495781 [Trichonephila clavipes]